MSKFAVPFVLAVLAAAVPAGARAQNVQSGPDRNVQDAIAAQRTMITTTPHACREVNRASGQIVVCGDNEENARQKLPLPIPDDAAKTTGDGTPRAPDLVPHYPGVVVGRGCFIPPCPKAPVYYFDITRLPEAPAGSDADKIARGEMSPP